MRGIFFVGCIAILLFAANCQQELLLAQTLKQANPANGQVLGDDLKLDDFVIQLHSHLFVEKRSSISGSQLETLSKTKEERRLGSGKNLEQEKKELLEAQKIKANLNAKANLNEAQTQQAQTQQAYSILASMNSFFERRRIYRINSAPNPTSVPSPVYPSNSIRAIFKGSNTQVPAQPQRPAQPQTLAQLPTQKINELYQKGLIRIPKIARIALGINGRGRLLSKKATRPTSTKVNVGTKSPASITLSKVESQKTPATNIAPKESYKRGHWFSLSGRSDTIKFPKGWTELPETTLSREFRHPSKKLERWESLFQNLTSSRR
jgi:hypothetical protein